jgi:hypothetical protein
MKTSKHLILVLSVMLVSLFLIPVVVQKAGAEKKTDDKKNVEYLFVQTAHAVTFQGGKMTLHGVSPTTLFFSDRPERITGHGATEEMVKEWSQGEDSFAKDPPNAVLSILGGNEEEIEDIVVVLRDPQLKGSQLTYTITLLDGMVPSHGGASALFIDVIGRPLTPLSYAGTARRVARRTTRRAVYRANARRFYTVPLGAEIILVGGTTYYVVNGVRYIKTIENGQVVYIEVD